MIDQPSETRQPSPEARRPIVVLLVDDQQFVCAAVGRLLAPEPDIELHCCDRAVDATTLANQIRPTVILQDLVMPDVDGLTLIKSFRANPATAATPVIVLSGNDDSATRTRALAGGAADYLVKLPARADLIACIRRHAPRAADRTPVSPSAATTPARGAGETLDRSVIASFRQAGSPDFTVGLIDQFIEEAGSQVQTLRDATDHGDRQALSRTAHSLKGSAMTMGAMRLAALCARVEDHLSGIPGSVVTPSLLTEVEEELVRVRNALAAER